MSNPARISEAQRNLTGSAIRRIRMSMKRKVTQEDLAGRLAVLEILLTQAQIAKIENGRRPINDFELVAIAKALRVTVQTIVDEAQKIRRTAKRTG